MKKFILKGELLDSFLFMDLYERTDKLGLRGSFALGATMEKEDEDVPAGIIVCTRNKDTLVIEWLYTVPEYRGLGIASELMFLAFEEAEASGLKKVAARISEEYEDNDLGWDTWSFFENDVFTGIEEDETEWRISYDELTVILERDEKKNKASAENPGVFRLCDLSNDELDKARKALEKHFKDESEMPVNQGFAMADKTMSFVKKKGDDYVGMLLIRKAGRTWYPFRLSTSDEVDEETLLRAALYHSEELCKLNEKIEIAVKKTSVKRLFEDVELPGREYDVTYLTASIADFNKQKEVTDYAE